MKKILLLGIILLNSVMAFAGTAYFYSSTYNGIVDALFLNEEPTIESYESLNGMTAFVLVSNLDEYTITDSKGNTILTKNEDSGNFVVENGNNILDGQSHPHANSTDGYVGAEKLNLPEDLEGLFIDGTEGVVFSKNGCTFIGFDTDGDGSYDVVIGAGDNENLPQPEGYSSEYISLVPNKNRDSDLALAYTSGTTVEVFNFDTDYKPYVRFYNSNDDVIYANGGWDEFTEMVLGENNTYFLNTEMIYNPQEDTGWRAEVVWMDENGNESKPLSTKEIPFETTNISVSSIATIDPNQINVTIGTTDYAVETLQRELNLINFAGNQADLYRAISSSEITTNTGKPNNGYTNNFPEYFENVTVTDDAIGVNESKDFYYTVTDEVVIAKPGLLSIITRDDNSGEVYGLDKCDYEYDQVTSNEVSATFYTSPLPNPKAEVDNAQTLLIDNLNENATTAKVIAHSADVKASIDYVEGLGQPQVVVSKVNDDGTLTFLYDHAAMLDGDVYTYDHNFMYDGKSGEMLSIKFVYDNGIESEPVEVELPSQQITITGATKVAGNEANYSDEFQGGIMAKGEKDYTFNNLYYTFQDNNGIDVSAAIYELEYSIECIEDGVEYIEPTLVYPYNENMVNEKEGVNFGNYTFSGPEIDWDKTFEVGAYTASFAVYTPSAPISQESAEAEVMNGDNISIIGIDKDDIDTDNAYFVSDYLTGVEGVSNNGAAVSAHNGNIYVNGAENVVIYNANGSVVYSGNDNVIPMNAGLYIVKANNATYKVIIK